MIRTVLDYDLPHTGKLFSLDSFLELTILKLKKAAEFLAQPNTTFSIRPDAAIDEGETGIIDGSGFFTFFRDAADAVFSSAPNVTRRILANREDIVLPESRQLRK